MSVDFSPQRPGHAVSQLPEPDQEAGNHSRRLVALILDHIARAEEGRIPFDRYMELALYAPGLGYYAAGTRKFGSSGDFITAPETSPLFARCLARQCQQTLRELGGGELLEFGAGSGLLAADLLLELDSLGQPPERYLILEVSAELRQRQRVLLEQRIPGLVDRVQWLPGLPPVGFRGVVIANEVLDAMPVHRFRLHGGQLEEQYVASEGERLTTCWAAPSAALEQSVAPFRGALDDIPHDYESEINMRGAPWLQALAERLQAGLVLLIDYGYTRAEYYHRERDRGTLMCHYRHRAHPDPLIHPGLQDITAHVEFSVLADAALGAGLTVCGYNTQALFLLGCGLEQLLAESDPNDIKNHLRLMQGVKRLTLPSEMGERFKVLGLGRDIAAPAIGFTLQNLRDRL